MKIKKFLGKNLQDAFSQMKEDLGENAIILNTRKVERPEKNTGKKQILFEVTAALDEGAITPRTAPKRAIKSYQSMVEPAVSEDKGEPDMLPSHTSEQMQARPQAEGTANPLMYQQKILSTLQKYSELESLKDEINEIKSAMSLVTEMIKENRMPVLPEPLKKLYKTLISNEIDDKITKLITQTILSKLSINDLGNAESVQLLFQKIVAGIVPFAPPLEKVRKKPYIISLVGPTGVGKTTTIAKIAASLKIFKGKKVGIITADTFRIAAVEQIQTFANIAGIPMEVVYEPAELPQAIKSLKDKDIILMDNVGRSQKKEEQIKQLKRFIDAANPHEVHLVMSLTSSLRNLLDVVKQFSVLKPNRFIFTKLDEVNGPGNVVNVCYKHKLPVSYITTGQIVPDDIIEAQLPMMTRMLMTGFEL
ncbi:MAG: flagellar biosynthesis protein FlhF [Calditrichia bacterium]